jgi:hypothetical protein
MDTHFWDVYRDIRSLLQRPDGAVYILHTSIVLLCYKVMRRQQGHRGSDRARWVAIRRRRVAIECGLCRSVLTGSASGREC